MTGAGGAGSGETSCSTKSSGNSVASRGISPAPISEACEVDDPKDCLERRGCLLHPTLTDEEGPPDCNNVDHHRGGAQFRSLQQNGLDSPHYASLPPLPGG